MCLNLFGRIIFLWMVRGPFHGCNQRASLRPHIRFQLLPASFRVVSLYSAPWLWLCLLLIVCARVVNWVGRTQMPNLVPLRLLLLHEEVW